MANKYRVDDSGRECTKCGTYKPWGQYYRQRSKSTGYLPYCKGCQDDSTFNLCACGKKKKRDAILCRDCYSENSRNLPPEAYRSFEHAKHRATKRGLPFELSWRTLPPINDNCTKCGIKYLPSKRGTRLNPRSRTLDRLIPALGYVPGNVMWLCHHCNTQKQDMTPDDFRWWVKFFESVATL